MNQLERAAKAKNLAPIEFVKRVVISNEPFTKENGLLTNTQKLKRHEIREKFSQELREVYSSFSKKNRI